jgi:hypothetical protein
MAIAPSRVAAPPQPASDGGDYDVAAIDKMFCLCSYRGVRYNLKFARAWDDTASLSAVAQFFGETAKMKFIDLASTLSTLSTS